MRKFFQELNLTTSLTERYPRSNTFGKIAAVKISRVERMSDMDWYDYASNSQHLHAIFPNSGLTTDGLLFKNYHFVAANDIELSLILPNIPSDIPEKWRLRGIKYLSVKFWFGCLEGSLNLRRGWNDDRELRINVQQDHLIFESVNGKIQGSVYFHYLEVNVEPFEPQPQ